MPFPTDEQLMKTASSLVEGFQTLFGKHPGFRPARFSTSTGLPLIPDTDANTLPHGLAVRFHLPNTPDGRRSHTDIISHSTESFPTRTGEEFLEMLEAIVASQGGNEKPSSLERFVATHPAAAAHIGRPKLPVGSYASDTYFGVNAFRLVRKEGEVTNVRYRFIPEDGVKSLSEEEFKAKGENYLSEELASRPPSKPIIFTLVAQVAEEGDKTDDCTSLWPEERRCVELGRLEFKELLGEQESAEMQKKVIYDPIPRIEGVEPSDDPMLEMRAAVYLLSGRQRREA